MRDAFNIPTLGALNAGTTVVPSYLGGSSGIYHDCIVQVSQGIVAAAVDAVCGMRQNPLKSEKMLNRWALKKERYSEEEIGRRLKEVLPAVGG